MPIEHISKSVLKNTALFTLLLFGLTACGGGSSSGDDPDTTGDTTTEEPTDTAGDTTTEELVDTTTDAEFIVLESMGIRTEMPAPDATMIDYDFIAYGISEFGSPKVDIRVSNNSENVIEGVSCTAVASKDGVEIDEGSAFFNSALLRPGDTAMDDALWFDLMDLTETDNVSVTCDSRLPFVSNDPLIDIELIEWTADEFDNPLLVAQLTNNSQTTIRFAECKYILRNGNEVLGILDFEFNLDFDSLTLGDIEPGQVFQATGIQIFRDRITENDTTILDREDLFCNWF